MTEAKDDSSSGQAEPATPATPATPSPHAHHHHAHAHPPAHDRDAINAAAQRHPGKPFQGSATRDDAGNPVSTTEAPSHAALLDPDTSGQAAGTTALPGDSEAPPAGNVPTDVAASSPVSNPGDDQAPTG